MYRNKNIKITLELSYVYRLFISYLLIIAACVGIMAVFSYNIESSNIQKLAIESSSDLLHHYKGTIDTLILDNIDKIYLLVLQNAISNYDIAYYFTNPVDGNYSGLLKVTGFLNNVKMSNPLINSITIYYKNNNLLVSTDGIKYSPEDDFILADKGYIYELFDNDVKVYWGLQRERIENTSYSYSATELKSEFDLITYVHKFTSPSTLPSAGGGSIAISVDEAVLYSLIMDSAPTDCGEILVIGESGDIVSHSKKDYLYKNIDTYPFGNRIKDLIFQNPSGHFLSKVNEIDYVVSYVSSDYNKWTYITLQPITDLTETRFKYLVHSITLLAVIILMFGVVISLLLTKKIYSPLKQLSDLSKSILKPRIHQNKKDEYSIIGSTLDLLSETVKEQEKKLEQSIPVMKHHFVNNMLHTDTLNEEIVYDKMEFLNINFHYSFYAVLILKIRDITNIGFEALTLIKLNVLEKIDSCLTDQNMRSICSEAIESNDSINIILNLKSENYSIADNVTSLIKIIESEHEVHINIGIGKIYNELKHIPSSYKDAVNSLNYSYIFPEAKVFTMKEVSAWNENTGNKLRQLYDEFCSSMKASDKKTSIVNILTIVNTIRSKHIRYNHALKILTKCVVFIEDTISELKINPNNITKSDIYSDFDNIDDIIKLKNWFIIVINQVFSEIDEMKMEKKSDFISQVKEFISLNILELSISLNYVSEAMHISPSYLSRIFKQETGINFVEYLMDCKLNTARDLLLDNADMKIEELCNIIGYSSPQYFIRKFKNKFGTTPNEYRLEHIRKFNLA